MKKLAHYLFFASMICSLFTQNLESCTGIQLKAKDNTYVNGRTFEFGVKVDTNIVVVPRDHVFNGTTEKGPGLAYKSTYAAVGTTTADSLAILDGMNEKGLCVGTFYFPEFAGYSIITPQNQAKAVSPTEFPNWIVTSFATVDEVYNALGSVIISPLVIKIWGATPPPFHYIVYDITGKCLVIEPRDGKLVTYDNPIGTFTNAPTFGWHMTNLRNYINLTPINVKPFTIDSLTLAPFGQGSGMVGLPGDFTPPSRFVRAAIFTATATPSSNSPEAVLQTFHILNQFDIPVGVAQDKVEKGVTLFDYTLMTRVADPNTLKYYFKTFDDQTIRFVDLTLFDLDAKAVKQVKTSQYAQPTVNISQELR